MTKRTRKVGKSGRFGPRYGGQMRTRWEEGRLSLGHWHPCPRCSAVSVRRVSSGVWACRRCGHTFAGGAYRPVVTTAIRREVTAGGAEEAKKK